MADSKVNWSQIADSVIADYKASNEIKPLYKFLDLMVSYKQSEAILKIIKDEEIVGSMLDYINKRYEGVGDIWFELTGDMWLLENREICLTIVSNPKLRCEITSGFFTNKDHAMFNKKWSDVLKMAYDILMKGVDPNFCADARIRAINEIFNGYV